MLLCLFDANDINNYITDITELCLNFDIKLIIGFSFEEIGKYLRSFK